MAFQGRRSYNHDARASESSAWSSQINNGCIGNWGLAALVTPHYARPQPPEYNHDARASESSVGTSSQIVHLRSATSLKEHVSAIRLRGRLTRLRFVLVLFVLVLLCETASKRLDRGAATAWPN